MAPADRLIDRLAIRDLLENWVVWHDAADWERFSTVWHEEGRMVATWFRAPVSNLSRRAAKDSIAAFASCIFWEAAPLMSKEIAQSLRQK